MTDVGYDEERSLWKRHVNDANTLRTALDDSFPSWMDRWMMNYAAPNDPNHPHGWMTMRGLQHVGQVGCKIAASFPLIASIPNENINVYSTRYERTKVRLNRTFPVFYAKSVQDWRKLLLDEGIRTSICFRRTDRKIY